MDRIRKVQIRVTAKVEEFGEEKKRKEKFVGDGAARQDDK